MELAISNIAWPARLENEALDILSACGIRGVEVAPTKLWPQWRGASAAEAAARRGYYESRGLAVSSLQAILFERPDCKLFGTASERAALNTHLRHCADLAEAFAAKKLVFGAPKNRLLDGISQAEAFDIACEELAGAADYFAGKQVCLCLEANPPEYGCEFITRSEEAARLVRAVGSAGLGLHLDTACMFLAGEDMPAFLERHAGMVCHLHVSEPYLGSFAQPVIDHGRVSQALRQCGYTGWISLEMRETEDPLDSLRVAAEFLKETYGCTN